MVGRGGEGGAGSGWTWEEVGRRKGEGGKGKGVYSEEVRKWRWK